MKFGLKILILFAVAVSGGLLGASLFYHLNPDSPRLIVQKVGVPFEVVKTVEIPVVRYRTRVIAIDTQDSPAATDSVSCTVESHHTTFEPSNQQVRRNRISLMGGIGYVSSFSLAVSSSDRLAVEQGMGFVGGVQFERLLTEEFSVGINAQTNGTIGALAGWNF